MPKSTDTITSLNRKARKLSRKNTELKQVMLEVFEVLRHNPNPSLREITLKNRIYKVLGAAK